MPETFDNFLQAEVNRNLLKYAAGQTMFCPLCERILDCRSTVNITAGNVCKTMCATCWDAEIKPKISAERLAQCDIVDGRTLWKKRKTRKE